jgi:hypothetical protein
MGSTISRFGADSSISFRIFWPTGLFLRMGNGETAEAESGPRRNESIWNTGLRKFSYSNCPSTVSSDSDRTCCLHPRNVLIRPDDRTSYIKHALFQAFPDPDDRNEWDRIQSCQSVKDLIEFTLAFSTESVEPLYFIVDQLDALDHQSAMLRTPPNISGADPLGEIHDSLLQMVDEHIFMWSPSANYQVGLKDRYKNEVREYIPLLGGMTTVSHPRFAEWVHS